MQTCNLCNQEAIWTDIYYNRGENFAIGLCKKHLLEIYPFYKLQIKECYQCYKFFIPNASWQFICLKCWKKNKFQKQKI